MRSLLNLLATGEGCDLVIICEGQFFFVHRAVISTQSPVLKSEISFSQFLDGEAYTLENVSPEAFRKILAFIYRGTISGYQGVTENNGVVGITAIELADRFPNVNSFLAAIRGGAGSGSKADTTSVGRRAGSGSKGDVTSTNLSSVTTEQKWAILTSKQRLLDTPYDNSPCGSPAEVMTETEVYTAAGKLQIVGLQDVVLSKIMAWMEKELRKGSPLSEDLRLTADNILRKEKGLVTPFQSLCTRYMPAVEQDASLVSLLTSVDSSTWHLLSSMRVQWRAENDQLKQDLLQQERRTRFLEASIKLNQSEEALFAGELTSQIHKLGESLNATQENHKFAEPKIDGLNRTIQSQQTEILQLKVAKLGLKDVNRPNEPARLGNDREDVVAKKPELMSKVYEELQTKYQKLRSDFTLLQTSQGRLKNELKNEKQLNQKLSKQYGETKSAFNIFMSDVNKTGSCEGCKRRWNFTVDHQK
ncbi:hypothetical protein LTR10_019315 [Elasticomyces elasticus]|uniref:BTB domain-containing protein n=1 Tax=Exophiala sideris TaxID=1016849 RepID=A0ABR0J100_9EURO|nr:hypothetical protein LTR10_019315 [Elasticomyces elasticus]KAK5024316.1 hypothetical protein LTS07_008607 [Exophiala sideris]KAK5031002.1 hypothetical protein LTR13_008015 [Exophiala sideris]KAK5054049.1 hypothetical protein LTR69_009011 [Exophiala sideris]KAK5179595.1 hypothetical protein LTR44_008111 [Eurotiomycetes sp. CCFEE 6388]